MNKYDGSVKPGYFKVRDQVHMGNQAGVSSSLRAVDKPKLGSRIHDPEGRRAIFLRHIRENPGKRLGFVKAMQLLKYNSTSSVFRLIERLVNEGLITRVKSGSGVFLTPVTFEGLDKGDPRNGEVIVKKLKAGYPINKRVKKTRVKRSVPVAPVAHYAPTGMEVFMKDKSQTAIQESVWDFIKANTYGRKDEELARMVRLMVNFSKFLDGDVIDDGVKNETKKEASDLRP